MRHNIGLLCWMDDEIDEVVHFRMTGRLNHFYIEVGDLEIALARFKNDHMEI